MGEEGGCICLADLLHCAGGSSSGRKSKRERERFIVYLPEFFSCYVIFETDGSLFKCS